MKNNIFKIIGLLFLFTISNFLIYRYVKNTCDWSRFREDTFYGTITKKYKDFKNGGRLRIEFKNSRDYSFPYQVKKVADFYSTLSLGDSVYKKENETLLYIQKRDKLEIINFDTIYEPCDK